MNEIKLSRTLVPCRSRSALEAQQRLAVKVLGGQTAKRPDSAPETATTPRTLYDLLEEQATRMDQQLEGLRRLTARLTTQEPAS